MKVGVWLEDNMNPNVGGGFSYTDKLIELIDEKKFKDIDVVFVTKSDVEHKLKKKIIYLKNDKTFKLSIVTRLINFILNKSFVFKKLTNEIINKNNNINNNFYVKQLKDNEVSVIYYLTQNTKHINNFPFITTNWDLGHLSMPSFPEVTNNHHFKKRQNWYNHTIKQSVSIFVESHTGKLELINYLNINPDRIQVLPIFSGRVVEQSVSKLEQLSILNKYSLQEQSFFFYPAQFWAHKNHHNLIKAFKSFSLKFPNVKLIFTGSDKGNLKYILKLIEKENLSEHVFYFGFVDMDTIYSFYKNAIGLVMPTFLGPTNMPLLEARDLECPVLCSDFEGHREQLADGALYFNPYEEQSIFNSLIDIMDSQVRLSVLAKARENYNNTIFKADNAMTILEGHLNEISKFRKCWD